MVVRKAFAIAVTGFNVRHRREMCRFLNRNENSTTAKVKFEDGRGVMQRHQRVK